MFQAPEHTHRSRKKNFISHNLLYRKELGIKTFNIYIDHIKRSSKLKLAIYAQEAVVCAHRAVIDNGICSGQPICSLGEK